MKRKAVTVHATRLADALARHTELSLRATEKRLAAAGLPREEVSQRLAAHADELAKWRSSILERAN
jgi:hypothetical protein